MTSKEDTVVPLSESTSESETTSDCEEDGGAGCTSIISSTNASGKEAVVLIDLTRRFEESLKYNKTQVEEFEAAMQAEDRQMCVHFHGTVSGVEIRSHRDYPECARRRLWNTFAEIQANADRNINEFRHDGWEWRQATEDDMMVKSLNGELVHPASYNINPNYSSSSSSSRKSSHHRKGGRKKNRAHRRRGRLFPPVRERASLV